MITRLVLASVRERPGRSFLLLFGYALGVGVTVALLSIGDALVEGARDRRLVGGGDVTVLPAGIDLETLKTGGTSALFFGIDPAPFLYRQVLSGPRLEDRIEAAAPWIEDALLYVDAGQGDVAVTADGQIPSRASALDVPLRVVAGSWEDLPADRRWTAPSDSARLAELDAFHRPGPGLRDTTWAEWHYFNVLWPDGGEWLYLTFMVAGDLGGRWGGRLLATRVRRDGPPERFSVEVPASAVTLHEDRPDLALGPNAVTLESDGRYRVEVEVPGLRVALRVAPFPGRYVPPLDVSPGGFPSGYVVPVLRGTAEGEVCFRDECTTLRSARAYHDHNWGTWRGVTWDWGEAEAGAYSVLYGGVSRTGADPPIEGSDETASESLAGERFLFLADSLGFLGVFRVDSISYAGSGLSPDRIRVRAVRGEERLRLDVEVEHALRTSRDGTGGDRVAPPRGATFHQMKGRARLRGRVLGAPVSGEGPGFFETWTGSRTGRTGRAVSPGG